VSDKVQWPHIHEVDRLTHCRDRCTFEIIQKWPLATILDLITPEVMPFNPPTLKILLYNQAILQPAEIMAFEIIQK